MIELDYHDELIDLFRLEYFLLHGSNVIFWEDKTELLAIILSSFAIDMSQNKSLC